MKVSELEGAELDYWVAKAIGYEIVMRPQHDIGGIEQRMIKGKGGYFGIPQYHRDWSQGGPIIEREGIDVVFLRVEKWWESGMNLTNKENAENLPNLFPESNGPTPLIAAMRCFVTSKFGEEVRDG
jgi:hypothetical protein